ncbi:monooxygenase [Streptomyces viridochromogenes]|uniref:Monooxygenase n=1 Tax=Streptomyces viridochromogenes TaxID=1938 RepID=A0A0J7Z6W8_STRVR|nr:NAD(P)/FAD-dependent oxidoreductase [Streptomyces viridochromogenes]KMS71544.1 monooxygenase [Streptomyces viridochromogenes]KOG11170.1 monooxygenase [Streptomyces viridochromogenes]KOG11311.1 monooxygenase [Streptomyces viridochromogenes]
MNHSAHVAAPFPPVAVIGAGPNGLATAAMLRRAAVPVTVLERAERVGASWAGRYDHLQLHTTRRSSHLPGLRLPRQCGAWVGRDDFLRYLEHYRAHHGLDVRLNTTVDLIEPHDGGRNAPWRVHTSDGTLTACAVVVATGRCHTPYVPPWPGREGFSGALLHAADYRNPVPYQGRTVLVVGAGNSGTEIAAVLSEHGARRVWLSLRTPPNILPRSFSRGQVAGRLTEFLPMAWRDRSSLLTQRCAVPDLTSFGVPLPRTGAYSRNEAEGVNPVLDHGFVAAVRSGRVRPVAAVEGFEEAHVVLADGTRLSPDVVIAATGYRPRLESLLAVPSVLDDAGYPVVRGPRTCATAPHLYFTGFTNPLSGALYQAGVEARGIARAVARGAAYGSVPSPRRPERTPGRKTDESTHR